jgi:ketosteroid isomerase-like protein
MTPSETIRAYYDSFRNDRENTDSYVHLECVIDEPTILPWGKYEIIGAASMHHHVGGIFRKVFSDSRLENTRYFEEGGCVVATSIWHMTGKHTGRQIPCQYHEYFEFRDGKISLMRPFYHAAKEMLEECAAAEAAGLELTP